MCAPLLQLASATCASQSVSAYGLSVPSLVSVRSVVVEAVSIRSFASYWYVVLTCVFRSHASLSFFFCSPSSSLPYHYLSENTDVRATHTTDTYILSFSTNLYITRHIFTCTVHLVNKTYQNGGASGYETGKTKEEKGKIRDTTTTANAVCCNLLLVCVRE